MLKITINDQMYNAPPGMTILQVCRQEGIDIPTFCNDPRLKPGGTCRMCVVEIEGRSNLLQSCAVPVSDGMVVKTHSAEVREQRKAILEGLLENHNTDCLVCEATGDCKLQDYAYEYGVHSSKFIPREENIVIETEVFKLDLSKCIRCGLCVKVTQNLQLCEAISFKGKGIKDPDFGFEFDDEKCVRCGNCVAVCPVGALQPIKDTSFRENQVTTVRSTCSYCSVGCQLDYKVKNNRIVDVRPAMDAWNQGMLCVKGRFAYHYVNDENRLTTPLIKRDGKFEEASWEEAYSLITERFSETKEKYGADKLGIISSAKITNEESYLAQKLARAVIGTNNVDHCSRL